jgi:hypothetical protein
VEKRFSEISVRTARIFGKCQRLNKPQLTPSHLLPGLFSKTEVLLLPNAAKSTGFSLFLFLAGLEHFSSFPSSRLQTLFRQVHLRGLEPSSSTQSPLTGQKFQPRKSNENTGPYHPCPSSFTWQRLHAGRESQEHQVVLPLPNTLFVEYGCYSLFFFSAGLHPSPSF